MVRNSSRMVLSLVLVCICLPMLIAGGCPPAEDINPTGGGSRIGIYVTNYGSNSVTVYSLDASDDATPLRIIQGDGTGLNDPLGIAKDTQSQLYVANRAGATVSVFDISANGNATPVRSLTDPEMDSPEGLVIGPDDGVFVSNFSGDPGVFHFSRNSDTSDYSIGGPNTTLTTPVGLALDEARNLFVANAFGGTIALFAPGQSGNQIPVRTFEPGGNTQSIAYGSASILLGTGSEGIREYHSDASGQTAWIGAIDIADLNYTGAFYFDVDVTPPVIYVADFFGNAIHIIQTVGVPPFLSPSTYTTIQGPSTGLSSPYGVLVVKS